MLILFLAMASASPWHHNPHVDARLLVGETRLVRGRDVIDAGVEFKVRDHWHVYWKNSGDAGFAPSVTADHSGDVAEVELSWPQPRRFVNKGGLQAFGYADSVVYPVRLILKQPAKKEVHAKLGIDYLVCDEECIPYRESLEVAVPVGDADEVDADTHKQIEAAQKQVPTQARDISARLDDATTLHVAASGDDIFFDTHTLFDFGVPTRTSDGFLVPLKAKTTESLPASTEIDITVTGSAPREQRVSVSLQPPPPAQAQAGSLWLMLLFAALGGLILNLMPCVLPVLSLKLLGLVSHESERDARVGAVWSIAGIIVSFLALAVAVLALRLAGWGAQFQEPTFVAFLAVVVVAFALNLWGVFEVPLPTSFGRLASAGGQRGPLGHFFAGLFATLLATPCSAPFLGTAIAFALSSTPVVVVSVFLAVGVGMSAPYIALAIWPRIVHLLPKPGTWMERLKQALGFALAATAVWLLFVLAGQLEQTRVALIELSLLGLAALLWLTSVLKRRIVWLFVVAAAVGTVWLARETTARTAGGIAWEPFDEARFSSLRTAGKPVFLDVTADWCFTCKVNERAVLTSEAVAQAFERCGIVAMKADWTKRDAKIGDFLAAHGRTGIPFYLLRGQVLPEILTERIVLDAIKGETSCAL